MIREVRAEDLGEVIALSSSSNRPSGMPLGDRSASFWR